MSIVLVIAPHPDDETLGCGGTLAKHIDQGDDVHWLIVTAMTLGAGFDESRIASRSAEIAEVAKLYGFKGVHQLDLPTASLEMVSCQDLSRSISEVVQETQAEIIYLPFVGDAHTDHQIVFRASLSATKWFRNPSVRRVLAYETLSETESALPVAQLVFTPTVFVDIEAYLPLKIRAMSVYKGEMGTFPFPRSIEAIKALAGFRGATCGARAAEAFQLLRERS